MPWTTDDPRWQALSPAQRAAAMALMERDEKAGDPGGNWQEAMNAAGAMVNRARQSGVPLGTQVSQPVYQPTIERAQQGRLAKIMASPDFATLTGKVEGMQHGDVPTGSIGNDTHFLAPERTMLGLSAREPGKYRSWRGWSGYGQDPAHPGYSNPDLQPVNRTRDHVYLAPDGRPALQPLNLLPGSTPKEGPTLGPVTPAAPFAAAPDSDGGQIPSELRMAAIPPGGYFGNPSDVSGWDRGATTPMPGTTVLGPDNDADVTPKVDDISPMERFVPGYEPATPPPPAPEPQVANAPPSKSVKDALPAWMKSQTTKDAVQAAVKPDPTTGQSPLQGMLSPFTKPGGNDLHANAVASAQKGSMAAGNKNGGQKQPTLSDALNKYAMAGISSPLPSQMQPRKPVPIYG